MGEDLPQGWIERLIGDIAKVVGGGTPKTKDESNFVDKDGIPWITPADLSGYKKIHISHGKRFLSQKGLDTSSATLMPEGTVLFSSRAPVGYVAIASNPIATNQGFKSFVLKEGMDSKYVYYYLRNSKSIAEKLSSGTTFLELSGKNAAKIPIKIPPFPEQKLIADKLDCLLAKVDACKSRLDKVPGAIKRFRQSVLADATSGRLTEDWREQNQKIIPIKSSIEKLCGKLPQKVEANLFQDNKGIILPKTWELVECLDICQNDRGVRYGVIQLGKQNDNGKPILRSSNVRLLKIELSNVKRIDPKIAAKYERTILEGGEVLVTIRGTLGGVADVPLDLAGYNVSREVAVLPIIDGFIPRYISFVIGSIWCQNWLSSVKKGVAYVGINLTDLKKLPIPLPPIEEQKEIVKRVKNLFSIADQMEEKLKMAKTGVEKLTVSILAKAFRGELVPQDFNDKPVEKL